MLINDEHVILPGVAQVVGVSIVLLVPHIMMVLIVISWSVDLSVTAASKVYTEHLVRFFTYWTVNLIG